MKLLLILLSLAVSMMLLTGRVVVAQPLPQQYYGGPGGQVSGLVWSVEVDVPIDWANIHARNAQHVFQVFSGMNGFYLMRLPNGTYTITAEASGYEASSTNVTVSDGSWNTVSFYLRQETTPVPEFQSSVVLATVALLIVTVLLIKRTRD